MKQSSLSSENMNRYHQETGGGGMLGKKPQIHPERIPTKNLSSLMDLNTKIKDENSPPFAAMCSRPLGIQLEAQVLVKKKKKSGAKEPKEA